ncbi:MAG: polyprotein [Torovirus sp.]|nr:MAG: polyprotein [Torovirus sp.]
MSKILRELTNETELHLCSSTLDLISKSQLLAQCLGTPQNLVSLSKMVPSILESPTLEPRYISTHSNSLQSLQLLALNTSSTLYKWTTGSISKLRGHLERELCRGLVPLNDFTPRGNYVELSLMIPSVLTGQGTSTTTTLQEMCSDMVQSCIKSMETDLLKGVLALKDQTSCQEYFLSANYQSLIPPQPLVNAMKMSSVVDLSPLILENTRLLLKLSPFHGGTSVSYTSMIRELVDCSRRDEKCLKRRLTKKQKRQEEGSFDANKVITLGGKMYRYQVVVLKCSDEVDDLIGFDGKVGEVDYNFENVPHCWRDLVKGRSLIRAKATWDLAGGVDENLEHVYIDESQRDSQRADGGSDSPSACVEDPHLEERIFSRVWLKQTSRFFGTKIQQVSELFKSIGLPELEATYCGVNPVKVGNKWLSFRDQGRSRVFFVYTDNNVYLATTRQKVCCDYILTKFKSVKWIGNKPDQCRVVKVLAWLISVNKVKNCTRVITPMLTVQGKISHRRVDYLDISVLDSYVSDTVGLNCVQKVKKFLSMYYNCSADLGLLDNFLTPMECGTKQLVFERCNCPNHQFYVAQFDNHVVLGLGRPTGVVYPEEIPSCANIYAVGFATQKRVVEVHYYSEMDRHQPPQDYYYFAYDQEFQHVGGDDYVNHHLDDVEDQPFPSLLFDDVYDSGDSLDDGGSDLDCFDVDCDFFWPDAPIPVPSPYGYYQGQRLRDLCVAGGDFGCDCPRCDGTFIYHPFRPRHYHSFDEVGPFIQMCEFTLTYSGQNYNLFYGLEPKVCLQDLVEASGKLLQLLVRGQLENILLPNDILACLSSLKLGANIHPFLWPAPFFNANGEWVDIFGSGDFTMFGEDFCLKVKSMVESVYFLVENFFSVDCPIGNLYCKLHFDGDVKNMLWSTIHMKYIYLALIHSEKVFNIILNSGQLSHPELVKLVTIGTFDVSIVAPCACSGDCNHGKIYNWTNLLSSVYRFVTLDQLVGLSYCEKRSLVLKKVQQYLEVEDGYRQPVQLLMAPFYGFNDNAEPDEQPLTGVFHQQVMQMFDTCVMSDVICGLKRPRASVYNLFGVLADYFRRPFIFRYYQVAEFSGSESTQVFTDVTSALTPKDPHSNRSYIYHDYAVCRVVEPRTAVVTTRGAIYPPEVIEMIRSYLPIEFDVGVMNYVDDNCDFKYCNLEFCLSGRGFVKLDTGELLDYKTNLFVVRYKTLPLLYVTSSPIYLSDFSLDDAVCLTGEFKLSFDVEPGSTLFGLYFTNGRCYRDVWETLPRFGLGTLSPPKCHFKCEPFENLAEVFFFKRRVQLVPLVNNYTPVFRHKPDIPKVLTVELMPYYSSIGYQGFVAPKCVLPGCVATQYCKLRHQLDRCVQVTKLAVAYAFYFKPLDMGSLYHLDPMRGTSYGKSAVVQFEPVGLIKEVNILVYQFGKHVAIHYFPECPTYVAYGHYPSHSVGVWLGYLPSVEECVIAQRNYRVYVPTCFRLSRTGCYHIQQDEDLERTHVTVSYHYARDFDIKSLTPMFQMFSKIFGKSKQDLICALNSLSEESQSVLTLFCEEFDAAYTLQTISDEVSFETSTSPELVACVLAYAIGYELCLTVRTDGECESLDVGSSLEQVYVDYDVSKNVWNLSTYLQDDSSDDLELPFNQYYEFKVGRASVVLVQDDFKSVYDFLKSEQGVDYVVNPANNQLKHGGGIAKVISCMCGPKLTSWSNNYIKQYKKLGVTCAIRSPGFQLGKGVQIIHVVGPKNTDSDVVNKLEASWRSVFQNVKSDTTVLTSMLSTGIFGCSVTDSAITLLSNLVDLDKDVVVFVVTNVFDQYTEALGVVESFQNAHGLPNFGNTCWFNALYQLLKSFAVKEQIVQDLVNCFDDFYECPTRQCVEWVCDQLGVVFGEQYDAVEMLVKIFDVFKCNVRVGYDCLARLQQVALGSCREVPADAVLMFFGRDKSGHWVAARRLCGVWYTFDDKVVTKKDPDWSKVVLVLRERGLFKATDFETPRPRRRRVAHRVPRDTISQDAIMFLEERQFSSGTILAHSCVESVESFHVDDVQSGLLQSVDGLDDAADLSCDSHVCDNSDLQEHQVVVSQPSEVLTTSMSVECSVLGNSECSVETDQTPVCEENEQVDENGTKEKDGANASDSQQVFLKSLDSIIEQHEVESVKHQDLPVLGRQPQVMLPMTWRDVFFQQYLGFKSDLLSLIYVNKFKIVVYLMALWFVLLYWFSDFSLLSRFCLYVFLLWLSHVVLVVKTLDLGLVNLGGESYVLRILSSVKVPNCIAFNCDGVHWLILKLLFYSFHFYDFFVKILVVVFQMPQLRCFTWPLLKLGFADTFLSHHILAFPTKQVSQSCLPVFGDERKYIYVPYWCKESFRTLVARAKQLTATGRTKTLDNWHYQCCSKTVKPSSCFNVRDFVFDDACNNHNHYGFFSALWFYVVFYSGFVSFWLPLMFCYCALFMCTFKNLPVNITRPIRWTVLQQVVDDLLSIITKPLFGRPACPPLSAYLTATTADEAVRASRSLLGRFCTPVGFQQPIMNVENGVAVSSLGFINPLMWPLFIVVLLDNRFVWFFNVLSYIMLPVFVIILFYFYLRKICGCVSVKGVVKNCTRHFQNFSKPLVAAGVHGNRTNFTYQPMQENWCDRHSWYCPKEEHYMTPEMAMFIKNYYNLATSPMADTIWCDYVKSVPNMTWANFKFSLFKSNETVMCGPSSHADSMLLSWYAFLHGIRFAVNPSVIDIPSQPQPIYVSSDSDDSLDKGCDVSLRPTKNKGKFKKQSVAYFSAGPVDLWYYVMLIIALGAIFLFMYSCFMVGQYVVMPRDKFFGVNPTGYSYVNAQPYLHASPPVLRNSDGMVLATPLKVPSISYSVYRLLSGHLYFTKLIVAENECTPPFGAARLSHEFTCNDFTYILPAHLRIFGRYIMLIHPDQLHMLPFEVEHSTHTRLCYVTGTNIVECLPTFEIISPYVFVVLVAIFTIVFLFLLRMYIVMYSYFKVFTYVVFKLLFVNTVMVLFVVCLPPLVPGVVFVLALWLCDSVVFLLYLAVLSLFILPWFYVMLFVLTVGGFVFWWMMKSSDVVHLTPDGLTFNGTFEQVSKCVFPLNPLIVNRLLLDCRMSHSDLVEKSKLKTTEGKLATEMMKVFMTGETAYYQPSNFSFQSVFSKVVSPFTLHARPPMPMFRLYVYFNGQCVGTTCTGTGFAIDDSTIVTAKHLFECDDLKPTHLSVELSCRSYWCTWKEPNVLSWRFEGENAYISVENLRDFYGIDFKYLPFQQIECEFYKRMEAVTIYSIKYGSEFATQAWQTVNGHFVCCNTEGGDSGAPLVWRDSVIGVHQGLCDSFKTTLASDSKGVMMTEVKGYHVDPPVYYKPIIMSAAYNKFVADSDVSVGECTNYHNFVNEDFFPMHDELEKVSFGDKMFRYCQSLPRYLEPLHYFHVPSFWQPFKKQSVSSNVSWVVENLHFIFSVYFLVCDFVAYWWLDDPFSVVLPLFFVVQLLSTVVLKNVLFWNTSYLVTLAVTFYVHSEVAESMYLLGLFSDQIVNRVGLILVVSVMCLFVVVRVVVNVKRAIFVVVVSVLLIVINVVLGVVQFNSFVAVCMFDIYAVFAALLTPQPVVAIMMLILFDTKCLMSFAFVVIVLSFRVFKNYKFVRVLHNLCNFDFVLTQLSLFRYRHHNQGNNPSHYEALWLFLKELYYGIQDVKYEVFSPQAGTYNVRFLTDMTEQDQLEAVEQVQRRLQRFSIVQDKNSQRLVLYSKNVDFLRSQIQQQRVLGANPFIITTLTSKDIAIDNVEVHNPSQFKPEDLQAHMWFYSKSPIFVGQVPIPTNVQTAAVLDTTYNCQDLTADEKNNVAANLQIQNAALTLSLFEECNRFLESELGDVPTLMWQSGDAADVKQLEVQIEKLRVVLDGMQLGTSEYKATRKQINILQSQLDKALAFERKLAKFLEKVDQQQAITNETAKQLSAFKNLVKQVYESYMSSLKVRVVESNDASCLLTSTDLPRKLVLMRPITGLDNIKIVEKANGCEITAFGDTFTTGPGTNLAGLAYSSTQPLSAYPFIFNLEGIFKQQANIGYRTVECNMSSDNGNVLYKGKIVAVPSEDNPDFVVCGKGYKLDCGINVLMIPSIVRYITLNLTDHLQRQSLKSRRRLQYKQQGVRLGGVNLGEHQAFSNELISSVGYTTWVSSTVCTDKSHKHPWFVQIPSNEKDPDWFMHNTQVKNNQWVVDAKPTHWLVDADTNEQLFALALTDEEYLKAESILAKWSPITQDVECWFKDLRGYYTVSGLQPLWPVCPKKICSLKIVPIYQSQSVAYADEPTHFLSLPVVNKNFLEAFYELQEGFPGEKQVAPHISLTMLKLTEEDVAKVEDILDEMVLPNTYATITNPHMMGQYYVLEVEGLQALHDEVVSVLRQHGIACDQTRMWKPHLTIGEIKDGSVFNKFKDFGITCKLEDCDFVKLGAPKANARYEFIATLLVGDLNC